MYELKKKFGKVLTNISVGTGPSSYEKRIYRPAVSQWLRNTLLRYTVQPGADVSDKSSLSFTLNVQSNIKTK